MMKFETKLDDGQKLTLNKSFWTGRVKVKVNNKAIGETSWKGKDVLTVTMKDGSKKSLTFKNSYLDPAPSVFLDGKDLQIARKLEKWQTVAVCTPMVLLIICRGGALPALMSVGLCYLNYFIIRKESWPMAARLSAIAAITVVPAIGLTALIYGPGEQSQAQRTTLRRPVEPSWTKNSRPAEQTEDGLLGR